MSTQHTPGPWWTTDYGIRDAGGYIAHTKSVQRYEGQDERYAFEVAQRDADKRLIAAAPDLLEACKAALSDDQPYIEKCKAAIAKATGEA